MVEPKIVTEDGREILVIGLCDYKNPEYRGVMLSGSGTVSYGDYLRNLQFNEANAKLLHEALGRALETDGEG